MNLTGDYYSTTSIDSLHSLDDIVFTNSSLKELDPNVGGSFIKFEAFYNEELEREEKYSFNRGKLFHLWMEHGTEQFGLMTVEKPSGKLGDTADAIITQCKDRGYNSWDKMSDDELVFAAAQADYGGNWKGETIVRKIAEGGVPAYVNEMLENQNKYPIYPDLKEVLTNCVDSIHTNEKISQFLHEQSIGEFVIEETLKESTAYGLIDGMNFKGLLDLIQIFRKGNKFKVRIIDYKTISVPVSTYMGGYVASIKPNTNELIYITRPGVYQRYFVYRQLAIYQELLRQELNNAYEKIADLTIECYVVAVETKHPFESRVIQVPQQHLDLGMQEVSNLLSYDFKRFKEWKNV